MKPFCIPSIFICLLLWGCSEKLLVPFTIDSDGALSTDRSTDDTQTSRSTDLPSDTSTGSDSTTVTGSDSTTITDSEAPVETDTNDTTTSDTATADTATADTATADTATADTATSDTATLDSETATIDTESDTYTYPGNIVFDPIGFAGVAALDVAQLTGGSLASTLTVVSTTDELQAALDAKGDEPLAIQVSGTLTNTLDEIRIEGLRDIDIIGTGDSAILDGVGILIKDSANIIIRNLTIHHVQVGARDGISITNSHHVWIDHCEVYNDRLGGGDYDGLLDITRGCDYITVSWNRFHDNPNGLIVGHDDANADEDAGKFHLTYHHNWFSNIEPGMLSLRFGAMHVFNNLFEFTEPTPTVGISARMTACVRMELNRFTGVTKPIQTNQSGDTPETLGQLEMSLNDYVDATGWDTTPACVLNVPYEYLSVITARSALSQLLSEYSGTGVIQPSLPASRQSSANPLWQSP